MGQLNALLTCTFHVLPAWGRIELYRSILRSVFKSNRQICYKLGRANCHPINDIRLTQFGYETLSVVTHLNVHFASSLWCSWYFLIDLGIKFYGFHFGVQFYNAWLTQLPAPNRRWSIWDWRWIAEMETSGSKRLGSAAREIQAKASVHHGRNSLLIVFCFVHTVLHCQFFIVLSPKGVR